MRKPKRTATRVALLASATLLAACQDAVGPSDAILNLPGGVNQLAALFDTSSVEVLSLPGAVYADHDESSNRLVFGVENASARQNVLDALGRLGVPASLITVRETEPILQVATLRDRWRPTQGGIQIHFGNFLCTMGFNVSHSGGRSFITNSHCTNQQGGTEGTTYRQPLSTIDPTVIATEVADPNYFRRGACPRGRRCRFSDASRALYSSSVPSNRGQIAKTTGPNNGSLTVAGSFAVTAQDNNTSNFPIGMVVNKVGRTTGWTQGQITNTCVNTNVSGTNITQLCQTFVSAGVGGGDSGSPVFRITSGDNVTLVGILWGGSTSGGLFVFSPLSQIIDELGNMTATQ